MLTLNQLITAATALPDADKRILIEKLLDSLPKDQHPTVNNEGHSVSAQRPIPPGTLTGLLGIGNKGSAIQRMAGLLKTDQPAPTDKEVAAMLEERLTKKYLS